MGLLPSQAGLRVAPEFLLLFFGKAFKVLAMKLVLATKNAHKLKELSALFAGEGLSLLSMHDFPDMPDVEEDGSTLEENAIKKAREIQTHTGLWTLADDTGLEVDALDGAPGVYSARFAGEPVSYDANNRKLLALLAHAASRKARFRTVIALAGPDGSMRTVEGRVDGEILPSPRGTGGFGYDPVFVPEGFDKTFAEMSDEEKNTCSHRARALGNASTAWAELLR